MWLLRCKNGVEITEAEMRFWDNVPSSVEIEAMAFTIARRDAPPYVIEMKGYEEYCVERIGVGGSAQGETRIVGYCLKGMKDSQVFSIEVRPAGMRLQSQSRYLSQTPDHCWRRGV